MSDTPKPAWKLLNDSLSDECTVHIPESPTLHPDLLIDDPFLESRTGSNTDPFNIERVMGSGDIPLMIHGVLPPLDILGGTDFPRDPYTFANKVLGSNTGELFPDHKAMLVYFTDGRSSSYMREINEEIEAAVAASHRAFIKDGASL
jgi:hypothetical protein